MTDYRDHLTLAGFTAWHITELARFASGGRMLEPTDLQASDGIATILETKHKNGEVFRTRVGPVGAEATRRIRDAGGFSIERYGAAVKEAAEVAEVKGFRGALRHSPLTWAEMEGEEAAQRSRGTSREGRRRSTTRNGPRRRIRSAS